MRETKSVLGLGRRRRMVFLLFALLPGILAFTGLAPSPAVANHLDGQLVLTPDTGGADDFTNPNRNDLNLLGFADDGSGIIQVAWSLDDTSVSGGEESQGCALYDTDGDGNVNYSLCVSLVNDNGSPALTQPVLYNCTDQKARTCSKGGGDGTYGAVAFNGSCELGTIADPFAGNATHQSVGGQVAPDPVLDSYVSCDSPIDDLTEGSSFVFLNVCTYPSGPPNADDKDCVVAPDAAFLTVAKVADGDASFPFTVDGAIVGDVVTTASFSLSGGESRDAIAVSTSSTINVAEGDVAGWELDSVVCVNDDNPAETDSDGFDIPMTPGQRWTCTFTNVPALQPPDIVVVKSADPTSVDEPGGSVTFTVQVTNNGGPGTIDSLVDDVHGDLAASCLDGGDVVLVGQSIDTGQTFTCTFSAEVTGNAGESETDTVTAGVSNDAGSDTASDTATVTLNNVPSAIEIIKTATPDSVDEPGGSVTFSFVINNLSEADAVTIDTLDDTIHGDLNGQGDCSVPQTIAAGGSYSCSFTTTVNGNAGDVETNVVTVSGLDDDGEPVSDTDDATVTVNDVESSIVVTKTASPTSVPESGGDVTYTFTVENTSAVDAVTINSLDDSIYGNLDGEGDCSVPQTIAAGDDYTCSITVNVSGQAGDTITNVVIASGVDDDGNPVSETGTAEVTITDVPSSITVEKTANPTSVPEPGGDVTFTFVVDNTSLTDEVTINSLIDSIYGNLDGQGDCSVPQTITVGGSYSCSITVFVGGNAEDTVINLLTVSGSDDDGNPVSGGDDATVEIADVPSSISVDKTASPTSVPETGGDVTYTVVVTNTSEVDTVTIHQVNDDRVGDVSASCNDPDGLPVDLAPTESVTCVFSDFVSGDTGATYTNVATALGTDDDGNPVQNDDSETVTFDDVPASIEITKTANPTTVDEPGGDVTFTFVINNTSAVDLVNIDSLTDSVYGDITTVPGSDCSVPQTLPVDGSYSCSFTVFVAGNANDFETNVVTAAGIDDDDEPVTAEDDATVTINDVPSSILTTKTASPSSVPESGGDVTFTIEVENTSTVDSVTIDTVTDSVFGDVSGSCVPALAAELLPGGSITCSFTEFISGDFPDSHLNVATASGVDDDGKPVSDDGEADVPFNDVFPEITVTKTADLTSVPETGGDVTFTFVATNDATEDATLDSMVDSDFGDLNNQGDCVLPQPLVANGGSYSCSITVFLSGDASGPPHNNVVTATAFDDEGNETSDDDDETVIFEDVLPDVSITKEANPTSVPETGGDVEFTIKVTNNSAEDATIDSLTDSDFDLAANCADAVGTVLAFDGSYTCVFTEFVEGDASGPPHQNTATVVASDGDGNTDTASDDAEVGFENVLPTITVSKTPDPDSVPETGAPVGFTIVVTNTSEEDVTITALTDSDFDLSLDCDDAVGTVLAPEATYSCSFTETISGDVGEDHENTVTANAVDNDGSPAEASATATVAFSDVLPDISVVKTANPASVPETGGDVTYTVEVTNNSTEAATLDSLVDDRFGPLDGQGDCATGGTIAPSDTYSCSFTIVGLTGEPSTAHVNIVTATASDDDGNTDSETGEATVAFENVLPDVSISKTANPTALDEPGGDVEFTIVVINNSLEDATIDSLVDTDFLLGTNCPDAVGTVLGFGESLVCVFTEFVAGNVGEDHENTATVVASDNDGSFDTESDDAIVTINGVDPAIEVVKDGPLTINEGGDAATYTVRITNNSVSTDPVTITSLIDDPFGDLLPDVEAANGGPITIAPGESFAFSFERELTLDGGEEHSNVITACGDDDEGVPICDDDDHTVTGENVEPVIAVDKIGPTNIDEGGDVVTYTVTITNNSGPTDPVTITSLSDDKFGDLLAEAEAANGGTIVIAPGGSFTFDFTGDVDLDAGETHTNTVTAVGTDNEGSKNADSDDHTVTAVDVAPVLNIEKTGSDTVLEGGDTATYSITIRNDSVGTDPVTITSLKDDKFGELLAEAEATNSGNPIVLQPGQEFTFSFERELTLDGGEIHTNVAEVCGLDDEDTEDCDEDDHPVTGEDVEPQMEVTKTPSQDQVFAPNEDVTFTIRVENTSVSTDPLTITKIDDDVFGDVSAECVLPQTIAANDAFECDITRDITADHANTATVTAEDDEGTEISDVASAAVRVINPSLSIEKSTNGLDADSAPGPEILVGEAVTWLYEVTNDGDVPLTDVAVQDDIYGDVCIIASLAVGATETCSVGGIAVEGAYLNVGTATATYTDADGDTAERSDSDPSHYFGANPLLTVSKTFADDTVTAGGAGSSFDLVVTNDGNVDLIGVSIADVVDDRLTVTGVSTTDADTDCSASIGQIVNCTADLDAGKSATITVDFSVASDVAEADAVSNTATVSGTYTDGAGNTADLADEATDTIDITVDIELSIEKTFDPSKATPGAAQSFTLVVSNAGPSDAVDVSVTDVVADLLQVTGVSVTAGSGDCADSSGQSVDCTVQVPAGESVTITVDYVVEPFLDAGSGNLGGDDFRFVFVNGSVLEGSTATGEVFLDGVDVSDDVDIVTGLSRNDLVFDPPGPDPTFELHLSCSDSFTGGWGQSGGPVEGVDTNWQIAYFSIVRSNNNGFVKECSDVTSPFSVLNEATANAEGSSGTETVTGRAELTIGPGITVDRVQTNGKRLTVYLTNGTSGKTIEEISVAWPDSNGDLTRIGLDDSTVWQGSDDPPDAALGAADAGWNGGTLATGESVLRLDFKNKAANIGYTVQVTFTDGTVLDISQ